MAAVLLRRTNGLCCIHRELCRVVWRPQAASYSSKTSDKKQQRKTHFKKDKAQPAIDINKLVEKLFSLKRSDAVPPAASKARLAKAPLKPSSSSDIFPAVFKALAGTPRPSPQSGALSPANPKTQAAHRTVAPLSVSSGTSAEERQSLPETKETKTNSDAESFPAPPVESAVESRLPPEQSLQTSFPVEVVQDLPVETAEVEKASVSVAKEESAIESTPGTDSFSAEAVEATAASSEELTVDHEPQTNFSHSETTESSHSANQEPLMNSDIELPMESGLPLAEPTEASIVGGPVESTIDITVDSTPQEAQPEVVHAVESSLPSVEPLQDEAVLVGAPLASEIDVTVHHTHLDVQVNVSNAKAEEFLSKMTVESAVNSSLPSVEPLQAEALLVGGLEESTIDVTVAETNTANLPHSAVEDLLIGTTVGHTVESEIESKQSERCSQVDSSLGKEIDPSIVVEEEVRECEKLTLESVTLHQVKVLVESLEIDEFVDTKSELDQKASLMDGGEYEASAGSLTEQEGEGEPLTEVLTKWESLSEDLEGLEGDSGTLVNELISSVPVMDSQTPAVLSLDPTVAAQESSEDVTAMTLESMTLHQVKVSVESLEPDELVNIKSELDQKASFVEGAECEAPAGSLTEPEGEGEPLTEVLTKWESLSEDLEGLEGDSGTLVNELISSVPVVESQTPGTLSSDQSESSEDVASMTLESMTLHQVKVSVESLETDELVNTKSELDEKASQVDGLECESAEGNSLDTEGEAEPLAEVLSKWDSLSEDLEGLEGDSGTLVNELICSIPAVGSQTAAMLISDPPEGEGEDVAALTLESVTLAEVKEGVESLEREVLLETSTSLEKEAEGLVREETVAMETEDVETFVDTTDTEILTLDIGEATDAIEAETSVMMEAMFGSEQGPKQPVQEATPPDGSFVLAGERALEQDGASTVEAMSLESVTLAEVEASLGNLDGEFLNEAAEFLEKEAEVLVEPRTIVQEEAAEEDSAEVPHVETLTLPDAADLSEDSLMAELLFTVPGHAAVSTSDRMDGDGTAREDESPQISTDLDPVQSLFLEKIREYATALRSDERLLEAEPDFQRRLSEETAKLQKLFGGGDLGNFPHFTFPEPKLDQET